MKKKISDRRNPQKNQNERFNFQGVLSRALSSSTYNISHITNKKKQKTKIIADEEEKNLIKTEKLIKTSLQS